VTILARRLYGTHLAPKSQHLQERLREIESGRYDEELAKLVKTDTRELTKQYNSRVIEPEAA
jgi:hypothetical protein